MSKENEKTVEQLSAELETQRKLNAENLVAYHKLRGVVQEGETASLQILATGSYDTVKQMLEARTPVKSEPSADSAETKALALVDVHFNRGAITADEKESFKKLAVTDFDSVKKILEARAGKDSLQTFVQSMSTGSSKGINPHAETDERAKWSYFDYFKRDPEALQLMLKNEPERHAKLVADFETESKKALQL